MKREITFFSVLVCAVLFTDCGISQTALNELSQSEKDNGYELLFNGSDLNNWTGNKEAYKVENENILVDPKGGGSGGNLYSKSEYSDFVLKFEFNLTPGANNGLGIHAPLEGDAAYLGKEIQILDNNHPKYENIKSWQAHGSVYGVIAAKRGALLPVGEWNKEEVIVKGSLIKVIVNETTIVDGDVLEASENGTLSGRDHPGLLKTTGHIGFCGHGDEVRFRNIRIKSLAN